MVPNGLFSDHRGSSDPKTASRSIFLAKDAKGAKKHLRYPKPLCELGALCENPKMASKWPKPVKNGLKRTRNGPQRSFFGSSGKFRSQDPVRSIFLAKDAKGAKKRLRYPKPLGELGVLCESPKMASKWSKTVKMARNRENWPPHAEAWTTCGLSM